MQDSFRKSSLSFALPSPTAAGNGQVTWTVPSPLKLQAVELSVSDTGAGAGSTQVQLNQNGNALLGNAAVIAQGAASKSVLVDPNGGWPGGIKLYPGDVVTVDIVSVPAGAAPKQVRVNLAFTQVDV